MKIIDLAKSQKSSKKCERNFKSINDSVDGLVLNQFSNNLCIKDNSPVIQSQDLSDIVDCVSDEKSLFKDINKKYEQLMKDHPKYESNENYLDLEDNDLEKFVESRMEQSEHIDIWESHSKEVLDRKRIKGM